MNAQSIELAEAVLAELSEIEVDDGDVADALDADSNELLTGQLRHRYENSGIVHDTVRNHKDPSPKETTKEQNLKIMILLLHTRIEQEFASRRKHREIPVQPY